jgi:A/G-specific adenine glycosylase
MVRSLLRWFASAARDLPWRRTRDPYAIWVSEVMLQQTTVQTVRPYFTRWMQALPTVGALAEAPLERVYQLWEGLGYYRRARNLHRAAQTIMAERNGRFPRHFAEVLALPGIGRYTAGAICSLAFNHPTPVVDGNVTRVLARLYGLRADVRTARARARLWDWAGQLVQAAARVRQARACGRLNEALMELGATVCTPRHPQCAVCPWRRSCVARRQRWVADIPRVGTRKPLATKRCIAVVFESEERWFVRQRREGEVNGGLWEFPQSEVSAGRSPEVVLLHGARLRPDQVERLGQIRHTITRHRIHLEVFHARSGRPPADWGGRWQTLAQLQQLPFSSAHRRIVKWLEGRADG